MPTLAASLHVVCRARLEERLIDSGLGFSLLHVENGEAVNWVLPGLTFADDIVLTAGGATAMQQLLDICADEAAVLGLKYNTSKSAVIQFAGTEKEKLDSLRLGLDVLPVLNKYKYLGVELSNEADYLKDHYVHLRQSATRGANILRKRSLWCCNRFVVSREMWKAVVVPGLTFANAVVCVPGDTRTALERSQREVGRQALGCHGTVANEAVQGDLGWSSFEAREATSKVSYDGRLRLMDRCRWAKRLFVYTHMTSLQSRWRKRLYQLEKKFGFFTEPVEATTEKEWESVVRKRVREQENVQWLEAARTKSTLTMYAELKQQITAETRLYDNSLGSRLLFEARAGALRTLVYKQRFDSNVQSTVCRVCEGESETAEHIILRCGGIRPSVTPPTEEANRLHEGVPPLATALGFSTTSERANTTEAFWKTIEQTKRRLEDWWHHTQHRGR